MATESTVRDALMAEMLGDIGKLHDAVESLKEVLPRQTETAEKRITGLIGLLRKAGDAYRDQMETYADSKLRTILGQMDKDASTARGRIDQTVEAARAQIEKAVSSTIRSSMTAPVQEVLRSMQQGFWINLGFCFLAGLAGGSVPLLTWLVVR